MHLPSVEISSRGCRGGNVRQVRCFNRSLAESPVDPEHAVAKISHEGAEFHFCSLACVGRFCADPESFAGKDKAPRN